MTDYAPGREFGLNPVALKLMPALAGMQSERRDAPHNIDAEQALLGAIMIDPRARARAREQGLRSEDFYEPIHAELFDKFGSMLDAGRPVDAITVLSEIDGEQPIDGRTTLRQYLGELVGHRAVTTASVNNYADTIRVLAGRRRWLLAAEDAAAAARDAPASELPTVLADLQRRFDDVRPLIDGNAAEVLFDFASKASAEKAYTPLIDRVLALGTVSIRIAPWQAGKTHVVVRMAYAIANGHPFMGREVLQGAVLLAPLEVRGGLDKRLVAANREYGDPGNRVAVLRGTGSRVPSRAARLSSRRSLRQRRTSLNAPASPSISLSSTRSPKRLPALTRTPPPPWPLCGRRPLALPPRLEQRYCSRTTRRTATASARAARVTSWAARTRCCGSTARMAQTNASYIRSSSATKRRA